MEHQASDQHRAHVVDAIATSDHPRAGLLAQVADVALRRAPDHIVGSGPDELRDLTAHLVERIEGRTPGTPTVELTRATDDPTAGRLELIWEDRPFLLSTVTAILQDHGIRPGGVLHPIIGVEEDATGRLTTVRPARDATRRISVMRVEVSGLDPDPAQDQQVVTDLLASLADIEVVTADHAAMRTEVETAIVALATTEPTDTEVAALLSWLLDDNLLLLGTSWTATSTGLGLLRQPDRRSELLDTRTGVRPAEDLPRLALSRTRQRSTVQRRAPIEVLEITLPEGARGSAERTGGNGRLTLIGLLTRKGIAEPVRTTPVLRRRLHTVLEAEDMVDGSHDAIALITLAHAIPKDELLRTTPQAFRELLVGLLQAEQHREVRAFTRPHEPSGSTSILVALPRERWQPDLDRRLRALLRSRFAARRVEVDTSVDLQRDAIARYLVEHADPDDPRTWTEVVPGAGRDLTRAIAELTRPWEESVLRELRTQTGRDEPQRLARSIVARLPRAYRDGTDPVDAVGDVLLLARALQGEDQLLVALREARPTLAQRPHDADPAPIRLLAAKRGATLELSSFIPILESLGLTTVDEFPHPLVDDGELAATLHDVGVRASALDPDRDGPRVAEAILAAWRGHLEIDPLNQLIVVAGLTWRDLAVLRAYRRLRRQLGTSYTPSYVDTILVSHPDTVRALLEHLRARFDPDRAVDAPSEDETRAAVLAALDRLERLDHDRILRRLLELIDATLRTNAFRSDAVADDTGEPYVALKYDPSRISDAPHPRPYREIFVHSPRVEGVHLRSGPVSRGGLRWSDRRDDVRSEVLDLVKAQVLKNAVIVPSGAKGGFVLTREPADPAARAAEARRQYITFIRGLLDVTDDLDGDRIVPPPRVIRHDGDDPYLVVAADRGTATYSDTANEVAARYGFWLDDAFASGGRHGYDHKRFGVTAKGAWVAVTAHFRELGLDVQRDPLTVVGIGDMSGDVFGNGLLRSSSILLVAAFDHRHVFVDPTPDGPTSFAERQRLYDLPGSCWYDYDRTLLSPGAMVVPRTAKRVPLTAEVRALLRLGEDVTEVTPAELIRAVLHAPVDLLFAGGIGTYVRATTELDRDLGDRVNAELRVEASTVRARVIGEGANLGVTQRARVELARRGTLLNQDAIDNAAGVATSDLEVNLKILLRLAEDRGLLSRVERDEFLEELAEEVVDEACTVVARSAAAISRELVRGPLSLEAYDRLMTRLETEADLDRAAEVLPTSAELAARAEAGAGLSRPEVATLLAWSKRELKEALLASDLPDSPLCTPALARSLPAGAVARFHQLLPEHRLRRELIVTVVTNRLIDRLGVTVVSRLADEAAVDLPTVAAALQAAVQIADAQRWWARLDDLQEGHDPARLRELELPIEELVLTLARVLLTDPTAPEPAEAAAMQAATASRVRDGLDRLGTRAQRRARAAHVRWLLDDLVEPDLAHVLAGARDLALVPDVAAVQGSLQVGVDDLAITDVLLQLSERLGIDRLEEALRRVDARSGWARRERLGLAMDLRRARRTAAVIALSAALVRDDGSSSAAAASEVDVADVVDRFLHARREHLERARDTITEAESSEGWGLDALGVATRAVRQTVERRAVRPG
jgi:glutamate dehydrogenase